MSAAISRDSPRVSTEPGDSGLSPDCSRGHQSNASRISAGSSPFGGFSRWSKLATDGPEMGRSWSEVQEEEKQQN